jgi:hypothetical protein
LLAEPNHAGRRDDPTRKVTGAQAAEVDVWSTHALEEARVNKVNAIVFVGDAMEEDVVELSRLAGQTDEGQVERLSRRVLHPFAPDVLVTLGGPLGQYGFT